MSDALISEIEAWLAEFRVQLQPTFVYGDVARILPDDAGHALAMGEADRAVDAGAYESVEHYFLSFIGVPVSKSLPTKAVAELLHEVLGLWGYDQHVGELAAPVIQGLDSILVEPLPCVQLMSRRALMKALMQESLREGTELLAECKGANLYKDSGGQDWQNHPIAAELAGYLFDRDDLVKTQVDGFERFYSALAIEQRHPLYPTEYGLCIPRRQRQAILDPIEEILREAKSNPSLLRRVTPREFEKVIGRIFEGFGFRVEITSQTRDGGADLICMSYAHGIPFKVAVEVKRYSEGRPVGVELVRSFVGANRKLRANKLVYVSTSRFTRDAIEYATDSGDTSLLELKAFPDVVNWAREHQLPIEPRYRPDVGA